MGDYNNGVTGSSIAVQTVNSFGGQLLVDRCYFLRYNIKYAARKYETT